MFSIRKPEGTDPGNLSAIYPGSELGVHSRFVEGAGTCAHCGMAIMNVYQVQIGNGDVYGVGSSCIEKSEIPETEIAKVRRAVNKHNADHARQLKVKKANNNKVSLEELIESHGEQMRSLPHPAISSLTLFDYANWVRENAGGSAKSLKNIKSRLGL